MSTENMFLSVLFHFYGVVLLFFIRLLTTCAMYSIKLMFFLFVHYKVCNVIL